MPTAAAEVQLQTGSCPWLNVRVRSDPCFCNEPHEPEHKVEECGGQQQQQAAAGAQLNALAFCCFVIKAKDCDGTKATATGGNIKVRKWV